MLENYLILSYLCVIITFQSIIGVGVLVLGTPFLLILKFNIIEIFFILLPVSIITSLLNLLIINFSNKSLEKSTFAEFKKFFIVCIPSTLIGLILLKLLNDYLNFKLLVAFVILISIILVFLKDKIKFQINFFRISILSIIGVVHGLTNSGGTLMSLVLSANSKKNYARLNTTFFYFVLAALQYFLTIIIFYDRFFFPGNIKVVLSLIFGVIIGNFINQYLKSKTYKTIVNFLAGISAIILVLV